jgi:hypothetical protein
MLQAKLGKHIAKMPFVQVLHLRHCTVIEKNEQIKKSLGKMCVKFLLNCILPLERFYFSVDDSAMMTAIAP